MMNPATMMKIMQAQQTFTAHHPKFMAFLKYVFSQKMEPGTVIEITVKRPNEDAVTSNLSIMQSDLDLVESLKDLQA